MIDGRARLHLLHVRHGLWRRNVRMRMPWLYQRRGGANRIACSLALNLAFACTLAETLAGPAYAETSSWVQREDAPAKPKRKPKPATTEAKPGAALGGPNVSTHSKDYQKFDKSKLPPTTVKPSGDNDDAYLAFDQGRYLTALALAEKLVEKGDAAAHSLIARIHAEGLGVAKNDPLAAQWYKRAAELGDIEGQFAYGVILAEGRGVEKDRSGAAEMFERAARTGHAAANYNLGLLFLKGDGKPENPYRAAMHIRYAAEKGIAAAQYDMATLHQAGAGVPHDAVETSRWLKAAADQGMAVAQYEYAVLLLKGLGLTADEPKAIEFLKAAAEKSIAGAQNRLAHIYLEGVGVEKNPAEAARWRLIAKAGGVAADKVLDAHVAGLSKAERQKAEEAAAQWNDRNMLP